MQINLFSLKEGALIIATALDHLWPSKIAYIKLSIRVINGAYADHWILHPNSRDVLILFILNVMRDLCFIEGVLIIVCFIFFGEGIVIDSSRRERIDYFKWRGRFNDAACPAT